MRFNGTYRSNCEKPLVHNARLFYLCILDKFCLCNLYYNSTNYITNVHYNGMILFSH